MPRAYRGSQGGPVVGGEGLRERAGRLHRAQLTPSPPTCHITFQVRAVTVLRSPGRDELLPVVCFQ